MPPSFATLAAARTTVSKPALVERYGPDDLRRGELRLPRGEGPFPVAVLIHGGCWTAAMDDMTGLAPLADALTARGFATWNVEYRRLGNPGGGWPGTFEDIDGAVDHVRDLARRYPLDLKRVIVVGHSAGAHLALWAASRPRLKDKIAGANPLPLAAVAAIDGPGDLAPFAAGIDKQVCGAPVIAPLMGGTPAERPAEYRLASPQDNLPLHTRQLLVQASLGELMQPYVAAARRSGDPVETLAAGTDHFDIITPGTPHGREVVDFIATRALPPR